MQFGTTLRRDFLKWGAAAAAYTAAPWARSLAAEGGKKPNVLFLVIDDLNDWIGSLKGHPQVKTPNLDRLAARGVNFEHAYCSSPACMPSRTSVLTGYDPSSTGFSLNLNRDSFRTISTQFESAVTLPQYFKENGYYVAGTGKIFHKTCDAQSWDEYYPSKEQQLLPSGYPSKDKRPMNGLTGTGRIHDWGPLEQSRETMGDWLQAKWLAEQLAKPYDKPFFLGYGAHLPHLPWFAPQRYFDMYPLETLQLPVVNEHDLDDVPQAGKDFSNEVSHHAEIVAHDQWKKAVQAYLACISFTDDCIGLILDALEASGKADETVIVLWSDHGYHLGEKLHWSKFALWEQATRNPLMFVVPGLTKADGVCKSVVSLLDIYPTLVDVCGLPPKQGLEGVSLRPLLKNPNAAWDRPALSTYKSSQTIRSNRWRYIRYADGTEELYDHENDPLEWKNLASDPQWAEVKADLAKRVPPFQSRPALPDPNKKKGGGEE